MAQDSGTLLTTVGRAGGLFAKAWPRLLAVFLIAELAHRAVQWVAVRVGHRVEAGGIALLALLALITLAMYVAMFLVLRGELPFHRRAVEEGKLAPDGQPVGEESRPLDALTAALLPFLAFYAAYQFLQQEALDYEYRLLVFGINEDAATIFTGGTVAQRPEGLAALSTWLFIGLGATAYLLRLLFKKRGTRSKSGPLQRLFVAYLEALWLFVVAYQALAFIPAPKDWLEERQVFAWIKDSYTWVLDHVLGVATVREVWDTVTGFIAAGVADLWTAAVLPLMWITITAVIYGRVLHKPERTLPLRWRFDGVTRRWQQTPHIVRVAGNTMFADWKDRWTPVADAFRLVARSGIRPMLGYFLAWAIITWCAGAIGIVVRDYVVGPRSLEAWLVFDEPLALVVEALRLMLQICLLAAAYDRMIGGLAGYLAPQKPLTVDKGATDLSAATSGMPSTEESG
ncbi:hypothetical protein [Kribbella deserti]|uniref:DUF4328 domain-containing protein n=1 Tax=Kribbella deserti TaxID=1926257 RepID=A0ABV6QX50_9ACTN